MGSYDGAEIADLVGLFILDTLRKRTQPHRSALYRDDGLAISSHMSGHSMDKFRKDLIRIFKEFGLSITVTTNLTKVDYLDVTLDLETGKYYPYRKPNEDTTYIHRNSNHPPSIIRNLVPAISRRISKLSADRTIFNRAAPHYNEALAKSGYTEKLAYVEDLPQPPSPPKRIRRRKILWFNPPST